LDDRSHDEKGYNIGTGQEDSTTEASREGGEEERRSAGKGREDRQTRGEKLEEEKGGPGQAAVTGDQGERAD